MSQTCPAATRVLWALCNGPHKEEGAPVSPYKCASETFCKPPSLPAPSSEKPPSHRVTKEAQTSNEVQRDPAQLQVHNLSPSNWITTSACCLIHSITLGSHTFALHLAPIGKDPGLTPLLMPTPCCQIRGQELQIDSLASPCFIPDKQHPTPATDCAALINNQAQRQALVT